MRLKLDDGYTLSGCTDSVYSDGVREFLNLPVVKYEYRPALPDAIYDWQMRSSRAMTGKDQLDAIVDIITKHITSWDVTDKDGGAVLVTAENVRRVPVPILHQILTRVTTWGPKLEKSAGNSERG